MAGYKGNRIAPKHFERGQIKIYIILLPLVLFMLLPIVFIICHAFKPLTELFAFPPQFIVKNPTWDNFSTLMKSARSAGVPMSKYVFNSLIVTIAVVGIGVVISTMSAYALSKLKFKLRGFIFEMNQSALMFVPAAVMIPRYLIIQKLGLTNTYWAHILPLIAMPVSLFLIKQFVDGLPDSLIEAAVVDGATQWTVYRKIIIPLIKPAIATGIILSFQQVWGYLDSSNLYVNTDSMKTLAFYMSTLANANNAVAGQGVAAAASLIMFLPNLILFIILQKDVMNTMAHSGIK
jgi:ABC-type glycerol-3-phosphate transport system permease component